MTYKDYYFPKIGKSLIPTKHTIVNATFAFMCIKNILDPIQTVDKDQYIY